MKRIISLFLAIVIMISMTTTSFAANSDEEYYTVKVEYSDNIGHQEKLDVMVQNNNVFVNAKMLAERLGYTFGENEKSAIIYNKDMSNGLPFGITQFNYDSTQVSHMLFNNMIDTYEAPFVSVKNSKGSWIPLEYSLLLLNSGMMLTDDVILIDIPTKSIIDYFYDIAKNSEKYNFDWADDFGYTETEINVLGGSSHLINVFNGLLGFDGASWTTLFQQFAGSVAAYDKKYGENLSMLLCMESEKELQATIDNVDMMLDVLDTDGKLGQMLSSTSALLDSQVDVLYKDCENILKKVESDNSPLVSYNKSYQALEDALDRQTWFSNTGGNILEVQKGMSDAAGKAFTFLDIGTKVLEVVGYTQEFQNQDKFSLAALTYYLNNKDKGLELPEAMKKSMLDYSDALSSSIGEYTTKRFAENVDQWIVDEIPMHEVLGTQAAAVLFAWDIASNTIPFIENGLSGADSFELALYSLVFQGDAFLNYLNKQNSVFSDATGITAENLYDIAQYSYIYLKSCYITREAALDSLVNKTNATKEKIQPLIDYQNRINAEIAKIMVELKGATITNDDCVFGFLPSNNQEYLNKCDDSQLLQWIRKIGFSIDEFGNNESNKEKFLGVGNIANGGIATGNDQYTFYITHPTKLMKALCQENNITGEVITLYTAQSIDSLNLVDNILYFHAYSDNEHRIMGTKFDAKNVETFYVNTDGISNFIVYNGYFYFNTGYNLVKCDLNGNNTVTLFEGDEYGIPFCIEDEKIYYSNPILFATGGFYYGKLFSMDLNGSNNVELISSEIVCNEYIFSDGIWLYFEGIGAESTGEFLRCRLDGNNLTSLNQYSGYTYNSLNNIIYRGSSSEGICIYDDSSTWTPILHGGYDNINLVGNWIYYTDTNYALYDSGVVTKRIKLDGSSETLLG